jgi:3-oxo-5-alpha-steroid 4-dehydrogenase 3 / polyprenol reductase
MDAALLCKGFFTIASVASIGGVLAPSFRSQIMNYGSRGTKKEETPKPAKPKSASILDAIASLQVPHAWFTHFYVASVASSIFWALQILMRGRVFSFLASQDQTLAASGMTMNQVSLAWGFMALQGTRRLYESITLTKTSQSTMWVGLWLIGIAFYIFIGISVWIEGIGECFPQN